MGPIVAALSWPILERIPLGGDLAISPHGIGTALGFLLGARMMLQRARRRGIPGAAADVDVDTALPDLLMWVGLGAVLGARGFYVLNHLADFADDPIRILAIWEGGLTLLGGITGGTLAGVLIIRRRGWQAGPLLDMAAGGLAAGIALGRFGDLAIGDHLGRVESSFPLAWQCTSNLWVEATNSLGRVAPSAYPTGFEPVQGCYDVPVIQTALFDVVAAGLTLLVLLAAERRWNSRPTGALAATFAIAYGTGRLLLDTFRGDERHAGLTASQWTAVVVISLATVWLLRHRHPPTPTPDTPSESEHDSEPSTHSKVD